CALRQGLLWAHARRTSDLRCPESQARPLQGDRLLPRRKQSMSATMRAALAATAVALAACSSNEGGSSDTSIPGSANERPAFVVGTIDSKTYNGTPDDLLTAGLGKAGLAGAAPAVANATNPTV